MLFYESYFEERNINRKPLISFHYKIITKFRQKKWVSFVFGKVYENYPKVKKKCYFRKPTLKRVVSMENYLFGPLIRNNKILTKKMGELFFREKCTKTARNARKSVILKNLFQRE